VTNTTVQAFVVILLPLESIKDTRIENLIAELNALRIRVAHLEAGQEVLDTQRDVDINVCPAERRSYMDHKPCEETGYLDRCLCVGRREGKGGYRDPSHA
jgi:hypothetical protein